MTAKTGFQSRISAIQTLIDLLNEGSLTLNQLNELEKQTRELHERAVILRYSSFAQKVETKTEEIIEDFPEIKDSPKIEEKSFEKEEFSFDFDTKKPESAPQEETVEFNLFEEQSEEISNETIEEKVIEPIEKPFVETTTNNQTSGLFFDSVDLKTAESNTFSLGKLNSLIGAFGLNERLQFINDLFDGDSDQFGEAIKQLDSRSDLNEAKQTVNYFAKNNDWDAEDESVISFLLLIKRRYA